MDHVSNVDTDTAEALPSAHEIEAAGQVPFDFGRGLDVPPLPADHMSDVPKMVETGEYTAAGDAMEGPVREPFGTWLLTQRDRKDWIGDLAKAAKADHVFPKRGTVEDVRARLQTMGADGNTFEALDDAELDWLAR